MISGGEEAAWYFGVSPRILRSRGMVPTLKNIDGIQKTGGQQGKKENIRDLVIYKKPRSDRIVNDPVYAAYHSCLFAEDDSKARKGGGLTEHAAAGGGLFNSGEK
ncbi:hypothetical protein JW933_10755 [candidate division FCPU426 bacterium]|nr:hypothetical protein [candidate division FCPU426 bacterium]